MEIRIKKTEKEHFDNNLFNWLMVVDRQELKKFIKELRDSVVVSE